MLVAIKPHFENMFLVLLDCVFAYNAKFIWNGTLSRKEAWQDGTESWYFIVYCLLVLFQKICSIKSCHFANHRILIEKTKPVILLQIAKSRNPDFFSVIALWPSLSILVPKSYASINSWNGSFYIKANYCINTTSFAKLLKFTYNFSVFYFLVCFNF